MQRQESVAYFFVDFGDKDIILRGKTYPKGMFATEMLNTDRDTVTKLLSAGAPIFQIFQDLIGGKFSEESFDESKFAILNLTELLFRQKLFSVLDIPAEIERIDRMFSEDSKKLLVLFHRAKLQLQVEQQLGKQSELTEEGRELFFFGERLMHDYIEMMRFYTYAPHDIANFLNAILNLEREKIRTLKKRDESNFAKAYDDFFSNEEIRIRLLASQVTPMIAGYNTRPAMQTEYISLVRPGKRQQHILARRIYFCRIMDFLVADFCEGLHVGHSPKQCEICQRYFLMTSGRHQKYCNGYAPGDKKHRSCRTVGSRIARDNRERSKDHPAKVEYRKRCNTVDHHLREGKIDARFASKVKELAKEKMYRAISDNEYFLNLYQAEMQQKAIYKEAEELLK